MLWVCAIPDLVRRDDRDFHGPFACQIYCYRSACRCRQFELDIACSHGKLVGPKDFSDSGRWIRIGSPRELGYSYSDANRSAPPSSSGEFEFICKVCDTEYVHEGICGPELMEFYLLGRVPVDS